MKKCEICGEKYTSGQSIDIGIGFTQITEDEPNCDCEYKKWLEEQDSY